MDKAVHKIPPDCSGQLIFPACFLYLDLMHVLFKKGKELFIPRYYRKIQDLPVKNQYQFCMIEDYRTTQILFEFIFFPFPAIFEVSDKGTQKSSRKAKGLLEKKAALHFYPLPGGCRI